MVKIRLRRGGKKNQPFYKIVAADSRASRTGKFIEVVGTYDPMVHPVVVKVEEKKLFTRLKQGAQPSDTVRSLLQRNGLWLKWNLIKKGADEAKIVSEMEKWQMMQTDKLRREVEKKARRKATRKKASAPAPEAAPAVVEAAPVAAEPAPAQ